MKKYKYKTKLKISVLGLALATGISLFGNKNVLAKQNENSLEKYINARYISVSLDDLTKTEKEKIIKEKISSVKVDEDDTYILVFSQNKSVIPTTAISNNLKLMSLIAFFSVFLFVKVKNKKKYITMVVVIGGSLFVQNFVNAQTDFKPLFDAVEKVMIGENLKDKELKGYEYIGYINDKNLDLNGKIYNFLEKKENQTEKEKEDTFENLKDDIESKTSDETLVVEKEDFLFIEEFLKTIKGIENLEKELSNEIIVPEEFKVKKDTLDAYENEKEKAKEVILKAKELVSNTNLTKEKLDEIIKELYDSNKNLVDAKEKVTLFKLSENTPVIEDGEFEFTKELFKLVLDIENLEKEINEEIDLTNYTKNSVENYKESLENSKNELKNAKSTLMSNVELNGEELEEISKKLENSLKELKLSKDNLSIEKLSDNPPTVEKENFEYIEEFILVENKLEELVLELEKEVNLENKTKESVENFNLKKLESEELKNRVEEFLQNSNSKITKEKLDKFLNDLTNSFNDLLNAKNSLQEIQKENEEEKNQNFKTYVDREGNSKKILWVQGINPPLMGEGGDFTFLNDFGYEEYQAPYVEGQGWYDTNKTGGDEDAKLCFAGVATNMLYWWMDQNKEEINSYISYLEKNGYFNESTDNFRDLRNLIDYNRPQQRNKVYTLLSRDFANRTGGFQTDLLIDYFINGFTPKNNSDINRPNDMPSEEQKDKRAGFFYDVFKNEKITDRIEIIPKGTKTPYDVFSEEIKKILEEGKMAGIVDTVNYQTAHIFTLWGAEFDENGKVTVIYITDTDDQDQQKKLGMGRYNVREDNGKVRLTNNINNHKSGPFVYSLQTLELGKDKWKKFFDSINENINTQN